MNQEIAWNEERECDYCGKKFTPGRPQDGQQRFCEANHRKQFFRYGAKLRVVAAISRDFNKQFAALEKRIAWLEKKSGKVLDIKPDDVITFNAEATQ